MRAHLDAHCIPPRVHNGIHNLTGTMRHQSTFTNLFLHARLEAHCIPPRIYNGVHNPTETMRRQSAFTNPSFLRARSEAHYIPLRAYNDVHSQAVIQILIYIRTKRWDVANGKIKFPYRAPGTPAGVPVAEQFSLDFTGKLPLLAKGLDPVGYWRRGA